MNDHELCPTSYETFPYDLKYFRAHSINSLIVIDYFSKKEYNEYKDWFRTKCRMSKKNREENRLKSRRRSFERIGARTNHPLLFEWRRQ